MTGGAGERGYGAARRARAWLFSLVFLLGGEAGAMTTCGTVITNVVSATMHSGPPEFVEYAVSYAATAKVVVACPPSLQMYKYTSFSVASSGTTVKFTICVVNETMDSVWGVVVTDRVPDGMAYVDMDTSWAAGAYGAGVTDNYYTPKAMAGGPPGATISWDSGADFNPYQSGTTPPPAGQGGTIYLRWTLAYVGPVRSACLTYRARVL